LELAVWAETAEEKTSAESRIKMIGSLFLKETSVVA